MGKQINYWMDYDSFVLLAQKAVELGCTIVKEGLEPGTVEESKNLSIVTPYGEHYCTRYYFHCLEAGDIKINRLENGKEHLDCSYTATGNAVIEADYSFMINEPTGVAGTKRKKMIRKARLYCITGYYDEKGAYIPRPKCLTKVYNALARYVKKLAPATELTSTWTSTRDENYGKEIAYKHKEYITKACLELVEKEGYQLF